MSDIVVITNTETEYIIENIGVVGPAGIQGVALVAPETPVDGDMWAEDSVLKIQLGGVTYNITLTPA